VANRRDGMKVEDLDPKHVEQLLLARKVRDKVNEGRGNFGQSVRDFFGNKRADSSDLYSYLPAKVERATLPGGGGYVVHSRNGNTMTVKQAQGGGFNFTGPNDPVDADIAALIRPAIERFEAEQKRSK